MISPRIMTDPGAIACAKLRDEAPIVLKTMDIDMVMRDDARRKKKKGPGSRLRLAMKYNGMLNVKVFRIL